MVHWFDDLEKSEQWGKDASFEAFCKIKSLF
jgi:hypothetical protein